MHTRLRLLGILGLVMSLVFACANPRRPSGGPRDKTPPAIEESTPASGATNVSPDDVRIRFSEYVDKGSFRNALSLSPSPGTPPEVSWSGRTATVSLPTPLRDNTTYLLTLGTSLEDVHGVSLQEPITVAFATGPHINRGQLTGRVVGAQQGAPQAQIDVFAYAAPDSNLPDSLPAQPAYLTQTGPDGLFQFDYLSEQPYYVLALRDENRNRQLDPSEPYAVPPRPVVRADTLARRDTLRWVLSSPRDQRPPEAQRVRALSEQRLAVRFSEAVLLQRRVPTAWHLGNELNDPPPAIQSIYMRPSAPRQVFLTTTGSLRPVSHTLVPSGVADSSGNAVRPDTLRFSLEGAPSDTLTFRFLGFLPDERQANDTPTVLGPDEQPGLRFNQPPPDSLNTFVQLADTAGNARSFTTRTDNGTVYRLSARPPLQPGKALQLRVTPPGDSTYERTFQRLSSEETGGLLGVVRAADTSGTVVIEVAPVQETGTATPRTMPIPRDTQFEIQRLPAGQYQVRTFLDRNANQAWDGGQFLPYEPAEPITWLPDPVRVRARWDSELPDTLHLSD